MIILIDIENQNILLYKDTGLIKIPFNEAIDLINFIGDNKVTYVTNAINVGVNDIINLINSLGIKTVSSSDISSNKYIHGIIDGTIYIREGLKFEGKYDCKLIDEEMRIIIQNEDLIKKLISTNKLEIIGENSKRKLDKEYKKILEKKIKDKEKSDKRLDSIIMDKRVDDWDGSIIVKDTMDAEEIDLNAGGRVEAGGGLSVNTMSELLEEMDKK